MHRYCFFHFIETCEINGKKERFNFNINSHFSRKYLSRLNLKFDGVYREYPWVIFPSDSYGIIQFLEMYSRKCLL